MRYLNATIVGMVPPIGLNFLVCRVMTMRKRFIAWFLYKIIEVIVLIYYSNMTRNYVLRTFHTHRTFMKQEHPKISKVFMQLMNQYKLKWYLTKSLCPDLFWRCL